MKTIKSLTEAEIAELPNLPDDWKWVRIGELCDVVRGGSPRPAGNPKFYGGTIPFLKVADLTGNEGVYLKSFEFTIKEAGLQKTRLVKPKTLLLSNSGATLGVPKICLFETTFNDGIAAFLNLDEKSLLFHYYYWVSKTQKLRAINQGAAQPNLNTNIISETPFPQAPLPEQRAIVSKIEQLFSELDNGISNLKLAQEQLKVYRQAVLKKAFEGELTKK